MTRNQILYQQNLETQRSNVANEEIRRATIVETARNNQAVERETNRHNVATEGETNRHNLQTESHAWATLLESQRHNVTSEFTEAKRVAVQDKAADETARHNRAVESNEAAKTAETQRHNWASEAEQAASRLSNEEIHALQRVNDIIVANLNNESRERIAKNGNDVNAMIAELDRLSREDIAEADRIARVFTSLTGELNDDVQLILRKLLNLGGRK